MSVGQEGATTTAEGAITTEDEPPPDAELSLALIGADSEPSRIGELPNRHALRRLMRRLGEA